VARRKKKNMLELKKAVIKEELVALTGDFISALALQQFLYWSERTYDTDKFLEEEKERDPSIKIDPTYGWIYKKMEELHEELMLYSLSVATVRRRVEVLVENGWVARRNNPKYKWDKTWQYRPDIVKIQTDLNKLGYPLSDYPLQLETSKLHGATSSQHHETALPEITTEITPDTSGEQPSTTAIKLPKCSPTLRPLLEEFARLMGYDQITGYRFKESYELPLTDLLEHGDVERVKRAITAAHAEAVRKGLTITTMKSLHLMAVKRMNDPVPNGSLYAGRYK